MKVNSISGITYQVADLARTAAFYEAIGFRRGKEQPDRATFYVNWFSVTFIAGGATDADGPAKGAGVVLYIKVDDVDDYHRSVVAAGMTPESEPASGNREFVLRDPDGYSLAFFQKK
jgi:predicted enzyme related to lactoylglutathione lyase